MNREELRRISEKAKKNKGINDALQGFVHDFSTRQVLGETKIHQVEQTVDRTVVELQQTRGEVREYQQKVEECHYLIKQMKDEMLGMQEKIIGLEKKNFTFEDVTTKFDIRLHRLDDFNKKFDVRLHSLSSETKERAFSRLLADFSNNDNSIDNSRTIENLECPYRPTLLKERDSKSPENLLEEDIEFGEFIDDEKTNEKSEDECTKEQNSDENSEESDEKSENAREQTIDEKSSEKAEDESFSTNDNNLHTELSISRTITLQPESTMAPHDIPSTSSDQIPDDSSNENNDEKLKLQKISEHERSFLTSEPGPSVIKKCNNSLASVLKTRKNIENRSLARTRPEPKTMVNLRKQRAEVKALAEKYSTSETCSSPESALESIVQENDSENISSTVPETSDTLNAEDQQSSIFLTETPETMEIKEVTTPTTTIETHDALNVEIEISTVPIPETSIDSDFLEEKSINHHPDYRAKVEEKIATVNELESFIDVITTNFDEKEVELSNTSDVNECLVPNFERAELLIIESYVDPSLNIGSRSSIGVILESFRVEPVEKRQASFTYAPLFDTVTVSTVEICSQPPSLEKLKRMKYKCKRSVDAKILTNDMPSFDFGSKVNKIDLPKLKPSSISMLKDTISKELEEFELSDSNDLDIPISDTSSTSKKEDSAEEKIKKQKKKKKKKKKKISSEENQIQVNQEIESDSMKLKVCIGSEDLIESKELRGELGVIYNKEEKEYVLDITESLMVESKTLDKDLNKNHIPVENLDTQQQDSTSSTDIIKNNEKISTQVCDSNNDTSKSNVIQITSNENLFENCINNESSIKDKFQVYQGNGEPDDSELQNNKLDISSAEKSDDLIDLEVQTAQTKSQDTLIETIHIKNEKDNNLNVTSLINESEYVSESDSIVPELSIDVFRKITGESEFSFTYIPEVNNAETSEASIVDSSEISYSHNEFFINNRSVSLVELKHLNWDSGIEFMTPIEESSELLDSHEDGDFMTPLQDCDELVDSHEDGDFMTPLQGGDELVDSHEECEFMTPVEDIGVMVHSNGDYEYMPVVSEAYNPAEFQTAVYYPETMHYELYPESYSSVYFGDWNSYTLEYSDEAYDYVDEYDSNENATNDFCAVGQENLSMAYSENEEYSACSDECHDKESNNLTEEITSIVEIKNTQKDVRFVVELEREMITQVLEPNVDQISFEDKKYSYPIDTCEHSEDEKRVEKKDAESQADKFTFNDAQNASNYTERLYEISPSKLPYSKFKPLEIATSPVNESNQLKKDSFTQTSELDNVENYDDMTNKFCPQGEEIDEEDVSLYLPTAEGVSSSMDVDENCGVMEEFGVCANCVESAKLRCGNCRQVFYCKRECQRDHWKKSHKDQCKPFKVLNSPDLGRYMVATRDLKAGDIILKEDPIVVGPKQQTEPVCLGCYKRVDGSYRCEVCSWPLCGPECAKSPDHQPECVVGKEIGSPIQINDFNTTNHFYEVIMPLRCLALKKRSPKKYQQFTSLESHYEDRKGTYTHSENQKHVVEMLRGYFMLLTFDPDEIDHSERGIHSALGICDTNALDINLAESTIQGIYPNFAMLEHSCTPNTKHAYISGRKVVLKAAVDIKQGEHLSTMYTHVLWGTYARREHIKHNKNFMCQCPRCSDPTELGTHFSALRCPRCPPGFLLPAAPLDELADWICCSCNFTMPADDARAVTVGLGAAVEQALMQPTTDLLETIIENNAKNIVHPNHFHLFVIRHTLLQMYGRDPTTQDEESMSKKEKLCQDFLKICTALDPGMARLAPFAGVALYEYHLAVLSRARGVGSAQQVDQTTLKKDLETAKALLQQCIKVLVDEPEDQPEGQLHKVAQQNLLELKQWEATVIESQT